MRPLRYLSTQPARLRDVRSFTNYRSGETHYPLFNYVLALRYLFLCEKLTLSPHLTVLLVYACALCLFLLSEIISFQIFSNIPDCYNFGGRTVSMYSLCRIFVWSFVICCDYISMGDTLKSVCLPISLSLPGPVNIHVYRKRHVYSVNKVIILNVNNLQGHTWGSRWRGDSVSIKKNSIVAYYFCCYIIPMSLVKGLSINDVMHAGGGREGSGPHDQQC